MFREIHEANSMTTVGQKRLARLLRFQDAADAFFSQGALIDAFQIRHVTHQRRTAMHVQIIEHDDPFGRGIRLNRRMNVQSLLRFASV